MKQLFRNTRDQTRRLSYSLARIRTAVVCARGRARRGGALDGAPLLFEASPGTRALLRSIFLIFGMVIRSFGPEGGGGIDVRATITGQAAFAGQLSDAPRQGSGMAAGVRAVFYPTIKLNEHWSVSGAVQVVSRPYYQADFTSTGNGVRARILQGNLSYTRVWNRGALVVRAGQVMSAFGSFLLRYDDADNPLTGAPQTYGYYKPVSTIGMTGAEADVTVGRVDARLQFTTSSSVNPRSVFASDQYANWAGGAGYTIRQGLRVGGSAYHGPYLSRNLPYYLPGEAKPRDLPANGMGIDGDWAIGHWNIRGEWQRFVLPYRAIPTFTQTAGYVEVQRVLHPRWFVAVRAGKLHSNFLSGGEEWSGSVGFRPSAHQIVKTGFIGTHSERNGRFDPIFIVQMTTTIHPLSLAWKEH